MGCVTSADKSVISCHPERCFGKRSWFKRSKECYEVKQRPKSNLPVATRTTDILSICDDFQDGVEDEKSYGYFSESISTANTSGISFNANDCDLKMEMYMMTKLRGVMPKTSSPILPVKYPSRHNPVKDTTYDVEDDSHQPQRSYFKWKRHLQRTPPYVLNNVTQIPEAIAGQFTPEGFPGYTDAKQCERGNIFCRRY